MRLASRAPAPWSEAAAASRGVLVCRRRAARCQAAGGEEENVYEVIRRQRAERRKAKKAAEAEARRASAESAAAVARGEGASSSRAQDGDTARFDWAAFAQGGSGAEVDGTRKRGQPEGRELPLGTYTGFQQKSGLMYCFSEALCGLRVGESVTLRVRADKGWFGSTTANCYTDEGAFLQTLNSDEQRLPWCQEGETELRLELLALSPPAGRRLSAESNEAWNSGWQQVERRPKA